MKELRGHVRVQSAYVCVMGLTIYGDNEDEMLDSSCTVI